MKSRCSSGLFLTFFNCLAEVLRYLELFIIPSMLTEAPVPAEEKQLESMMGVVLVMSRVVERFSDF